MDGAGGGGNRRDHVGEKEDGVGALREMLGTGHSGDKVETHCRGNSQGSMMATPVPQWRLLASNQARLVVEELGLCPIGSTREWFGL